MGLGTKRVLLFVVGIATAALWTQARGAGGFDLPSAVQATVEREFAGSRITEVGDGDFDGVAAYEVEGVSAEGMSFRLEIGRNGRLHQKEERLSEEDLPPNIVIAIHREIGNAEPENIRRITENGVYFYQLESRLQDESVDLKLTPAGLLLEREEQPYAEEEDDEEGEVVPPRSGTRTPSREATGCPCSTWALTFPTARPRTAVCCTAPVFRTSSSRGRTGSTRPRCTTIRRTTSGGPISTTWASAPGKASCTRSGT